MQMHYLVKSSKEIHSRVCMSQQLYVRVGPSFSFGLCLSSLCSYLGAQKFCTSSNMFSTINVMKMRKKIASSHEDQQKYAPSMNPEACLVELLTTTTETAQLEGRGTCAA